MVPDTSPPVTRATFTGCPDASGALAVAPCVENRAKAASSSQNRGWCPVETVHPPQKAWRPHGGMGGPSKKLGCFA
eukprot:CAMPEP_0171058626 /NCGR_PEP_ID=MMETSP0766_2-20121228/2623_1 /TAXON_ID=439317 /ORGANISM="Gambierdiscus australes, Strain CAWD 149" /LENGTH=75 /DNA_ID=CAMNT_0011513931 /DNA_START=1 /DNA_END=224 /DNA_ORIENTATION=+